MLLPRVVSGAILAKPIEDGAGGIKFETKRVFGLLRDFGSRLIGKVDGLAAFDALNMNVTSAMLAADKLVISFSSTLGDDLMDASVFL